MALLRFFVLPLLRSALHRLNVVTIFQNKGDIDNFVQLRLVPKKQTRIIMSTGVNVSIFRPCGSGVSNNSQLLVPICIMACRFIREKGIAEFVEAAKLLRKSDVQARFWLVGEPDLGNPTCISKKQLEAWKKEKIVEVLGHRLDIPQLLQQADIFLLTSLWEGFGLVVVEAMAAGLPVVVSNVPGVRELVGKDSDVGFLVHPKNESEICNQLSKLTASPELRLRMGNNAQYQASQFDIQKTVDDYLQLYDEIRKKQGILL
jgi:glycosyltransferase involved in cell wall biosynthesis